MEIKGLTYPWKGEQACSRLYVGGHTFRWVKGDRYIAVLRGTCIEQKRYYIIKDDHLPKPVLEGLRPLVDAIPIGHPDWADTDLLRHYAENWLRGRGR